MAKTARPISRSSISRHCAPSPGWSRCARATLRRLAKINCFFEWLIGYHLYYAELNDASHQSQVCSTCPALGRAGTSPLGGCRSPSDRTRRDHTCCRSDWAATDDHSCGLQGACLAEHLRHSQRDQRAVTSSG